MLKDWLLRSHKEDKSELCRNIHSISLCKNYVFDCHCSSTFVGVATFSFHWLIMGKMKIGICCYVIADILTKVFFQYFSTKHVSFVQTFHFYLLPLQQKSGIWENYSKSNSSEAMGENKTENLQKHVYNISLYKNYVFYWRAQVFLLLWLFDCFHGLIFGKLKKRCFCFHRTFSEAFVE